MHYALFETAIGACGVAWSTHGLLRMQLPGADRADTERRLSRHPASMARTAPPEVARAIASLQAYMAGQATDFGAVRVDLRTEDPISQQVNAAARRKEWGRTLSYGELARRAGMAGAAREVGQALARNPVAIIIPCHRILASGDRLGGFSAFGGPEVKRRLLALEGVRPGVPQGQSVLF